MSENEPVRGPDVMITVCGTGYEPVPMIRSAGMLGVFWKWLPLTGHNAKTSRQSGVTVFMALLSSPRPT